MSNASRISGMIEGAPGWFIETVKGKIREEAPGWFVDLVLERDKEAEAIADETRRVLTAPKETEGFEEQLKGFIVKTEAGRHGYNAYFGIGTDRAAPAPPKPVTQMTLNEVLQWQQQTKGMSESTAVGGYQIIHGTLRDAKRKLNLTGDEIFDEELQDRIASDYLLRQKRAVSIDDFLSGKATMQEFANDLAKEWASLPVLEQTTRGGRTILPGQSYYGGVGSNKALVDTNEFSSVLKLAEVQTENEGES